MTLKRRGFILIALACLCLAGVPAGGGRATAEAQWVREPSLRKIDDGQDAAVRQRVEYYRRRLPEPFRWANNFAWARADIRGLRKKEYFAHSRIQDLAGLSSRAAKKISGISPAPPRETARFTTLIVDYEGHLGGPKAVPRWFDTEYKIMEDLAARLPDASVQGNILLYTDLQPCPSCWGVMQQFLAVYTNLQIEVLYDWP